MTVKSETTGPLGSGTGAPSTPGILASATARYYTSPILVMSTTSVAVLANIVYYQPMLFPGMPIDRIGIDVTTGAAGLCRLGIYSNNAGAPGDLMLDAGTVDTTNIATVEATITTMYLPAAWVWVCALFNATPGMRIGSIGNTSLVGVSALGTGNRGVINAFAFAALPAVPAAAISPSANIPMIAVRKTA